MVSLERCTSMHNIWHLMHAKQLKLYISFVLILSFPGIRSGKILCNCFFILTLLSYSCFQFASEYDIILKARILCTISLLLLILYMSSKLLDNIFCLSQSDIFQEHDWAVTDGLRVKPIFSLIHMRFCCWIIDNC